MNEMMHGEVTHKAQISPCKKTCGYEHNKKDNHASCF